MAQRQHVAHHLEGADLLVGLEVHHAGQLVVGVHRDDGRVVGQVLRGVGFEQRRQQDQAVDAAVADAGDAACAVLPVGHREDGGVLAGLGRGLDDAIEDLEEVLVELVARQRGGHADRVHAPIHQRARGGVGAIAQLHGRGEDAVARLVGDARRGLRTVEDGRSRHHRHPRRTADIRQRGGVANSCGLGGGFGHVSVSQRIVRVRITSA
jgi:hypothetical protein